MDEQPQSIYRLEDDDQVKQASLTARNTFKFFWRELSWEYRRIIPGLDLSAVKLPFRVEQPASDAPPWEHMWVGSVDFDGFTIRGELLNDPNWVTSLTSGDEVAVPFDELSDWMYAIEGKVYGGFTVNLMRSQMSKGERNAHDSAWGLDFGDASQTQLAPKNDEAARGFGKITRLFSAPTDFVDPEKLERTEHPMSINMGPKTRAGLSSDLSLVSRPDSDGWTMLHRESLAGNLTPVKILLELGADRSVKTNSGLTALDLAKRMGWPLLVACLE